MSFISSRNKENTDKKYICQVVKKILYDMYVLQKPIYRITIMNILILMDMPLFPYRIYAYDELSNRI